MLAARPPPFVEVRPQLGVQRHTAEQVIETFVPVQVLDASVPQLGEVQVVEFLQNFDAPAVAEPVIKVPKISLKKARRRMGDYLRPPQTAEQLVEVPTIAYFSSLLRTAEHVVDIPVPHVRGGWGGEESLQGFSPGLGSTAFCGADLDIPVPGRSGGGGHGGLQGSLPGQNSAAFSVEQNVDIPVPHGGPHLHDPGLASLPQEVGGEAFQGVFSSFPRPKKSAKLGPHSGSELSADFTPSTPAAYVDSDGPLTWVDDAGNTWWQSESGRWYLDRDPSVWWDAPG